jgi:glycosyltransferase involved in cell wall biosynthesis
MNKVTKVCNVDEEGRFGGPERRIVQVADALSSLDIETTVVYPSMESEVFERYIQKHGVRSLKLNITRLTLQKTILFKYVLKFIPEIFMLYRVFRKEKFALIHVNGSYQFKVAIAAKLAGIPVVWHLNDTYAPRLLKVTFGIMARLCANGFIVAGNRVKEYYLNDPSLDKLPCIEVHAPVNLNIFNPSRFDNQKKQETRKLRVGAVSGINPTKGIECFIDVVSKVLKTYPNIEFLVAGAILDSQKSYYQSVLRKIERLDIPHDSVRFLGLVEDIPSFINDLDICLFTSITEASPTSIWEALAMAKPVITTDVGSVSQYIEHGVSGYIAPIGNATVLADCVLKLIENEDLRLSLANSAREVAKRGLSIESAAMRTKEIYSKIGLFSNA